MARPATPCKKRVLPITKLGLRGSLTINSLEVGLRRRFPTLPSSNRDLVDWYHNTGVIIFACLSSWFVAVLGGGLAWVFLIMAVCGTYYRTSLRRVRRNFRDDVQRELAKNRLETDTESLEWINSFLVKFWPIFQPVLAETIINSVDQVLSTSTPAFLDSLRMKTFTLGNKPPRMEHVKTYPKAEDDVVLMDWKFSFTPNDHADMTSRQIKNKVNPKIVLEIRIGKAMISKGLDVYVYSASIFVLQSSAACQTLHTTGSVKLTNGTELSRTWPFPVSCVSR